KKSNILIQQIDGLHYDFNNFYNIEIEDYNFDGVMDFSVYKSNGSLFNKEYVYYINQGKHSQFKKLNLFGYNFSFDDKNKTAVSEKNCIEDKTTGRIITLIKITYSYINNEYKKSTSSCNVYNENNNSNLKCSTEIWQWCSQY